MLCGDLTNLEKTNTQCYICVRTLGKPQLETLRGTMCGPCSFIFCNDDHNHEIVLEYCIVHGGRILNTPSLLYYYDKKHEGS